MAIDLTDKIAWARTREAPIPKPEENSVSQLEPALAALRAGFIGWQCRIRQHAMRRHNGRPTSGMCPRVSDQAGRQLLEFMTTVMLENDPTESVDQFRQIYHQTNDPAERYRKALEVFAGAFYQWPERFCDELCASFQAKSRTAAALLEAGDCVLEFRQFNHAYHFRCRVENLAPDDIDYQFVYLHNRLFAQSADSSPTVLAFIPIWDSAAGMSQPA
ncbi:MAG: hypothetical protein KGJ66_15340 [Alphaproteobacteria bacterium]|nr:hypothetical protein [Alphaproteobacteria bacterium]